MMNDNPKPREPVASYVVAAIAVVALLVVTIGAGVNIWYTLFERPGRASNPHSSTLVVIMSDKDIGWRKEIVTNYGDEETCRNLIKAVTNPEFLKEERATGLTISAECIFPRGAR